MLKTTIVDELAPISQAARDHIAKGDKSTAEHLQHMTMPCLNSIEHGGSIIKPPTGNPLTNRSLRTIAWNLERCLDVEGSAELLRPHQADIILLSEMDHGMARTQQRHTTRELARLLDMEYLYGVEFVELDLGSPIEQELASDQFNTLGWHGNAVLSRWPIQKAAMLRLDDHGQWFAGQNVCGTEGQPRIGGRMALFATISLDANDDTKRPQPCTVVSTHLESNGDDLINHRGKQMSAIIDALHDYGATNHDIIIGGDLNTGNNLKNPANWRIEKLFSLAEAAGFHWDGNQEGVTVRPSKLTLEQQYDKQLDWFCARGLRSQNTKIIPAIDQAGTPLSDHEAILSDWLRT